MPTVPYQYCCPTEVPLQPPVRTQVLQKYPYSPLSVLMSFRSTPTVHCQYSSPPRVRLQSAVSTAAQQMYPYSLLTELKSSRSTFTVFCQYSSPPEVLLSILQPNRSTPTVPCQYSNPPEVLWQFLVSSQILQDSSYNPLLVLKSSRCIPVVLVVEVLQSTKGTPTVPYQVLIWWLFWFFHIIVLADSFRWLFWLALSDVFGWLFQMIVLADSDDCFSWLFLVIVLADSFRLIHCFDCLTLFCVSVTASQHMALTLCLFVLWGLYLSVCTLRITGGMNLETFLLSFCVSELVCMCGSVFVCVCVSDREGETEGEGKWLLLFDKMCF